MAITMGMVLDKIEEELMKAKQSGSEPQKREHVYAIKALCEILLETNETKQPDTKPAGQIAVPQAIPSVPEIKSRPLKMDDGANGDSIFDF
ncbi:YwdI family protein [Heyndrickxia acidiproducens]|uniref:YwdI family protein n=1 Tax=Heyndrickxia acidiproducens TaxID=1121084 RepID=UPI00035E2A14|nr:YwdI family protein [Heyndrickxia acidiproducens]